LRRLAENTQGKKYRPLRKHKLLRGDEKKTKPGKEQARTRE